MNTCKLFIKWGGGTYTPLNLILRLTLDQEKPSIESKDDSIKLALQGPPTRHLPLLGLTYFVTESNNLSNLHQSAAATSNPSGKLASSHVHKCASIVSQHTQ
ncbi:hypothetical protein OCU04_011339 [Sclerotinia nivalis]|uniref:Uncharacterized protein n=1 Tax=Sclerotinia nivalis TaxID=352851 RepID=A0A9X0ABB3_9HELO|nr:hypothetical protein OCU04_011339 [Sclerotinia nivalis]